MPMVTTMARYLNKFLLLSIRGKQPGTILTQIPRHKLLPEEGPCQHTGQVAGGDGLEQGGWGFIAL